MSDPEWAVVNSGFVADTFRRAAEIARARGRLAEFVTAVKWAMSELERTPGEFGESRGSPPFGTYEMRGGFARPIYVEYAVHWASRTVFLRRFAWSGR